MNENQSYSFSNDWFQNNITKWSELVSLYQDKKTLYLEIGSYEGQSTFWMMNNVLLHPDSKAVAIDTFEGSMEHDSGTFSTFIHNANIWQSSSPGKYIFINSHNSITPVDMYKLIILQGSSLDIETNYRAYSIQQQLKNNFDIIYIDGSHRSPDVLSDAVFAFKLCKVGGIIIFDDYKWKAYKEDFNNPKQGIDSFIKNYNNELEIIYNSYQLWIRKTPPKLTEYKKIAPQNPFIIKLKQILRLS